jgi:HEAT repeat protein
LVEAAGKLKGRQLVGVINSIGAKRSTLGVDELAQRLNEGDEQAAAAAAVALGKIGNEHALHALHQAFHGAKPALRSAIAEGGILCAERCLADGNSGTAVQIYDVIRTAGDLPKQRIAEATRGAIIARGDQGIPLLVEQLKSSDEAMFQIALSTARELKGDQVAEALADQLATAEPERAALIVYAIGDREGATLPPAVLDAAANGNGLVRLAAIKLVGRLGDEEVVSALLEIAAESDNEIAGAAKEALTGLPGKKVDADIVARMASAKGKLQGILIELVGGRRIEATDDLVKALKGSDESIRAAALAALGETVGPDDLDLLVAEVVQAKNDGDRQAAERALLTASIRMPDREATAAELSDALSRASTPAKASLLKCLGAMGGPGALQTIAVAAKSGDDQLQDSATRALGEWMTADAGPVLLEIAQDSSLDQKYQIRALRGYLRIARQLKQLPDEERISMARQALQVAERPEERELALDVLKRCPSAEGIELASSLLDDDELRDRAVETAIFIGEQIKDTDPAAAKSAGEKALEADPSGELAERARALAKP